MLNHLEKRHDKTNVGIYLFILFVGLLLFWWYPRVPDVITPPPYLELARSLMDTKSYGYNFHSETLFPPGLPFLLAVTGFIFGLGLPVVYRFIAVCLIAGLIASYELLRRAEGRGLGVIATVLFASAPVLFSLAAAGAFADVPYFAISMVSLLLALKGDGVVSRFGHLWQITVLSIFVILSVLMRSVGIALLTGLCAWIIVSYLRSAHLGRRRASLFVAPLLLGVGAQLLWSYWAFARQSVQWPLPGYPQSYLSQLQVKSGNEPEQGFAHAADLPARAIRNTSSRAAGILAIATHHWVEDKWFSPAVLTVESLIATGWLASIWEAGGQLYDWYFASYEAIYALWPWDFEVRFLIPVAPLAFLYIWRGAKVLWRVAVRRPQIVGWVVFLPSPVLALYACTVLLHARRLQMALIASGWIVISIIGVCLLMLPRVSHRWFIYLPNHAGIMRLAAGVGIAVIAITGCMSEMKIAHRNLTLTDLATTPLYPDIEAARWIRLHSPGGAVLMARRDDLVYHYSGRRVIWFPPISNPQTLLEGIRRYGVNFVIIIERDSSYWRPAEEVCFDNLRKVYGSDFTLVHRGPKNWIFAVRGLSNSHSSSGRQG